MKMKIKRQQLLLAGCVVFLAGWAEAGPAVSVRFDGEGPSVSMEQTIQQQKVNVSIPMMFTAAGPDTKVPAECDRPGKVHWVQFETFETASKSMYSKVCEGFCPLGGTVYLLKVNADDGSRSILLYESLPTGLERCRASSGPYAPGSPAFLALESLEVELQDCCSVENQPWLYFISDAQDSKSNFKGRIKAIVLSSSK